MKASTPFLTLFFFFSKLYNMQNNTIPPHLMQQFQQQQQQPHQQQQQQRVFHPQVAYPLMSNIMPSERTQGVFSTYPARLKHSDDNALLLPESYVPKKTRFRGNESEDEFDQMMEESDEDEDDDTDQDFGQNTTNKTAAGTGDRNAAANEATRNILPGVAAPPPPPDWPRLIRQKNEVVYSSYDLSKISETEENLVPIRLDIDIDSIKLRDRFLWNLNEQYLTLDKFAIMLCQDLDLPIHKFLHPIVESIRAQINDFESYSQAELPSKQKRVIINVSSLVCIKLDIDCKPTLRMQSLICR